MSNRNVFSVVGVFDTPHLLLKAIPEIRKRVDAPLEAYTPYPIEGIDRLLGLRKSPIGGMTLAMGVLGAIAALAFQLWTSGRDYPQLTAGKPFLSWEAFVPIMFEVTVLFATFTAGLGMLLLLNRLPMFQHPMLRARSMKLITRDKFALSVSLQERAPNPEVVSRLLLDQGAALVEVVDQPDPPGAPSPHALARIAGAIAICCVVAGALTYWAIKLFPIAPPMVHMLDQPRLDPQRHSSWFRDGFGMRMPVPETVARGSVPTLLRDRIADGLVNPTPRSAAILRQGKRAFDNYCTVCHGALGNGAGSLTAAYGAKPANLVAQGMVERDDGSIYHAIIAGKNAMPSYAADLSDDERWATVHYVRVLQRAMNARDEDIPR